MRDPLTNGDAVRVLRRHRTGETDDPVVLCKNVDIVLDLVFDLIRELHDDSPCGNFDHHGYCQNHCWLDDSPCGHGRAQQLLAQQETNQA